MLLLPDIVVGDPVNHGELDVTVPVILDVSLLGPELVEMDPVITLLVDMVLLSEPEKDDDVNDSESVMIVFVRLLIVDVVLPSIEVVGIEIVTLPLMDTLLLLDPKVGGIVGESELIVAISVRLLLVYVVLIDPELVCIEPVVLLIIGMLLFPDPEVEETGNVTEPVEVLSLTAELVGIGLVMVGPVIVPFPPDCDDVGIEFVITLPLMIVLLLPGRDVIVGIVKVILLLVIVLLSPGVVDDDRGPVIMEVLAARLDVSNVLVVVGGPDVSVPIKDDVWTLVTGLEVVDDRDDTVSERVEVLELGMVPVEELKAEVMEFVGIVLVIVMSVGPLDDEASVVAVMLELSALMELTPEFVLTKLDDRVLVISPLNEPVERVKMFVDLADVELAGGRGLSPIEVLVTGIVAVEFDAMPEVRLDDVVKPVAELRVSVVILGNVSVEIAVSVALALLEKVELRVGIVKVAEELVVPVELGSKLPEEVDNPEDPGDEVGATVVEFNTPEDTVDVPLNVLVLIVLINVDEELLMGTDVVFPEELGGIPLEVVMGAGARASRCGTAA
ncbi:hypothetical protein F5Y18DRAFT_433191 [Xylariaceae sp. FL1019]|nr:hypothetical protein F5Y18DRAFT_433191 [Xylariaceae sp. FL1019]